MLFIIISADKTCPICDNSSVIKKREVKMSNLNNEMLLERFFEEGLEMGLSDKEAEEFANKKFEEGAR